MFFRATIVTLGLIGAPFMGAYAQDSGTNDFGISLNPGETIVTVIPMQQPTIIQIPVAPVGQTETVTIVSDPPYEIDRVRGIPRNRAGWTGDDSAPAAIACFPKGVCSHLNQ